MRLKRIEIVGFKSFADRVVIRFDDGITAIVGPNGCGKSNIIDAFRWVLGEQSAKSMRGEKMLDVIFSGTATRSPMNSAEVSLVFSNEDGLLAIDFSEVIVSRRVFRSGESEYRINRNLVRLKDIHSLFLGSGLGKGSFSVFEQGKIDQIIHFSPVDRRFIFEEAAGILRFKQRKKEALSKLENTRSNLERVRDIHTEVQKQVETLARQAEVAQKYRENKLRLEALEKAAFVAKWKAVNAKGSANKKQVEEFSLEKEKRLEELESLEKERKELFHDLEEQEEAYEKAKEKVFKAQSEKEVTAVEQRTGGERLNEMAEKKKKLQIDLKDLGKRRKESYQQVAGMGRQHQKLTDKLTKHQALLEVSEKKRIAAEGEVQALRQEQKQMRDDLLKAIEKKNQALHRQKDGEVSLESCEEKLSLLEMRRDDFKGEQSLVLTEIKEKRKTLEKQSHKIDHLKRVLKELVKEIDASAQQRSKIKNALEKLMGEVAVAKARRLSLVRLRDEMEGMSSDTKRLLKENSTKESPLKGLLKPLYQMFTAKPGHEKALATVLRHYAQTLVVKSRLDRETVLAFAESKGFKEYSIFCLEDLKAAVPAKRGKRALLDDIEESELARHFLGGIFRVENLKEGWKLEGCDLLIGEQAVIDSRQVFSSVAQGEGNAFLREAEVKALTRKVEKFEKEREEKEKELELLDNKDRELSAQKAETDHSLRRSEMSLVEVNMSLQRALKDKEKLLKEQEKIAGEMASLKEKKKELQAVMKEYAKTLSESEKLETSLKKSGEACEKGLEKKELILEKFQKEYEACEKEYHQVSHECTSALNALKMQEVKDNEWKGQQKLMEEELVAIDNASEELIKKEKNNKERQKGVEKELHRSAVESADLKRKVSKTKEQQEKLENKLERLRLQQQKLGEKLSSLDVRIAKDSTAGEAIEETLRERYAMTIEEVEALELPLEGDLENTEKVIQKLRYEIDKAGNVNMASIDEYQEHKVRHQFLTQQTGDLKLSEEELMKIIGKLDGESRKAFRETFKVVRENFKKNFEILFGGGEADLKLTESQDILEAGVEIVASPPGKQMRSISLLSGGEKCMTAMALLFAIFEVKPAPFCLLDEIDAPLDDSNIMRFVNVLKQFIEKTQFIIVTHNKRTMAIADILWGVSMQERGVSKLLSLEFAKEGKSSKQELAVVH